MASSKVGSLMARIPEQVNGFLGECSTQVRAWMEWRGEQFPWPNLRHSIGSPTSKGELSLLTARLTITVMVSARFFL